VPGGELVGRHNHTSKHDRRKNRGPNRHSRESKNNSQIDRLRALSDPQGLGWSGA